ncbi:MAG: MFS transporter [Armatimonadota bacterium]
MIFEKLVPVKARRSYYYDAWGGCLVGVYSGGIFTFVLLIAKKELHAGPFLLAMMTAAPFIGNCFALLWANAMEGKPKMPFAVGSWYFARAIFIAMLFATSSLAFSLIVITGQFFSTIASPAYAAIMKDVYPDEHRGRIMGYVRVITAFTTIISTLIVGVLLKSISYRWIFPVAAVLGVLSSAAFSRIKTACPSRQELENKRSITKFIRSSLAIPFHNQGFGWFAISVLVFGFGTIMLLPVYPIFQNESLNMEYWQLAVLTNVQSVAWMFAYLYWGRYVDRRSPLRATVVNVYLTIFVAIGYCISTNWWMLLPAHIIAGITNAGIELAYFNSILAFSEEKRTSHYQALFSFLIGIRGTLAPIAGAKLAEIFTGKHWDLRYTFLIAACIMFIGATMQLIGLRREQHRKVKA